MIAYVIYVNVNLKQIETIVIHVGKKLIKNKKAIKKIAIFFERLCRKIIEVKKVR